MKLSRESEYGLWGPFLEPGARSFVDLALLAWPVTLIGFSRRLVKRLIIAPRAAQPSHD